MDPEPILALSPRHTVSPFLGVKKESSFSNNGSNKSLIMPSVGEESIASVTAMAQGPLPSSCLCKEGGGALAI